MALGSPRESSGDEEEDEVFERNMLKNGKRFAGVFSHIFDKVTCLRCVSIGAYDRDITSQLVGSPPPCLELLLPLSCLQYDREFDSDESGAEEVDLADVDQLESLDKQRAGMYAMN